MWRNIKGKQFLQSYPMKQLLFCLAALFISASATAAWNQEKFCRDSMKGNAEYAEWGFRLRDEMHQKCGSKPTQSCLQKYRNIIFRQGEKLRASVEQAYAGVSDTDFAYRESVMRVDDQIFQALWAWSSRPDDPSGQSVKNVVKYAYEVCMDKPMNAPDPIQRPAPRSRRQQPPMPPIMPMPDLIGKPITQPGATIAPISGGCTNYTVMGQNGRAAYCQKCCYGDGNCQVMCD